MGGPGSGIKGHRTPRSLWKKGHRPVRRKIGPKERAYYEYMKKAKKRRWPTLRNIG